MKNLEKTIDGYIKNAIVGHIAVRVGRGDTVLYDTFRGGVAGNAGVFSNISDLTKYVGFLLNKGKPLIEENTFAQAVQNYTAGMSQSRGLGFLHVDERYEQTGGLFKNGAIGHCGHTGQSVFVDYRTGLYVIILSDATVSTVKNTESNTTMRSWICARSYMRQ